jgi:calcineurin-like phosphoesterase family protein
MVRDPRTEFMMSAEQLSKTWAKAVREHALAPLTNPEGRSYRAIGDKSLTLLDGLWKEQRKPAPDIGAMLEAGRTVRFWSDPHFGHDNIRHMCGRTLYHDLDSMDRGIWENWERAVEESDLVVCLGDLSLKNPLLVQRRAVAAFGSKHILLVGNHDTKGAAPKAWAAAGAFATTAFSLPMEMVQSWIEDDYPEEAQLVDWRRLPRYLNMGLCHWPVPPSRMPSSSWVCLHGHIHHRASRALRVNCSVEAIDYRPRTLRELLTPNLLDVLVRRQNGIEGFLDADERMPGDSQFLPGPG